MFLYRKFYFAVIAPLFMLLADKRKYYYPYPRFIEFPDGNGMLHRVDLAGKPDRDVIEKTVESKDSLNFLLFTRDNIDEAQNLLIDNEQSITSSNFDSSTTTVLIAHGWISDQNSEINLRLRDAFLSKSNFNVIVLDWSELAHDNYVNAVFSVPLVGEKVGNFLSFLQKTTGISYSTVHLVGHSLGAHVVGNAGKTLNGQLARITGLDPAGPLWYLNSNRLKASDAVYVEAIHTNCLGGYGIILKSGDADIYPNGGIQQPGCRNNNCNHNLAWKLFAMTVIMDDFVGNKCKWIVSAIFNNCRGETLNIGNSELNKTGSGLYGLKTDSILIDFE